MFIKFIYSFVRLQKFNLNLVSNHLCKDQHFCDEVTQEVCKRFPELRKSCPKACGLCTCTDTMNCDGINPKLCENFPTIQRKCPEKCNICTELSGKLRVHEC